MPVLEDDTPDTLAVGVFQAECAAYPEAIQWIADGRVRVKGRRVRIAGPLSLGGEGQGEGEELFAGQRLPKTPSPPLLSRKGRGKNGTPHSPV